MSETTPPLGNEGFPTRHPVGITVALIAAAFALCVIGYLALATPGAWFPAAGPRTWSAADLVLSRGAGTLEGDELVVREPDASGTVLVTVTTEFPSRDYRAVAWIANDVPEAADVRVLWRSDYAPQRLNAAPLAVATGRIRPAVLAEDGKWVGRITGLALTLHGPLPRPVRIRGVVVKPMGAPEIIADRFREWFAFEGWSGTSIESVTGGADVQSLPLPAIVFASVALAALAALAVFRGAARAVLPVALASSLLVGWVALDIRWIADLARQASVTAQRYAGKDWRERHLAAEDGALFAFLQKADAKLPPPGAPGRVFVAADAHYFRSRAAYHLYPRNVYFDPYANTFPPSALLRPGDYVVVFQRRGIQYDAAAQRLRWDAGAPVGAELLLAEAGAALFRIR